MLTLDQANAMLAAARHCAAARGFAPVSIYVLDAAAYPLAFARMDGCFLGAIDVALGKARTAALFRADSAAVGAHFRPGAPAFSLENTNGGLVGFGGGVALRNAQGDCVGAIGVSGATMEEDQLIAEAGAAALAQG